VKNLMSNRVLISAGGGGHTGYAYALGQRLFGRALLSFLVPEGDALSKERLSRFGHVSFLLKPRGAKTPTSEFIPNRVAGRYDCVVSTGSNFSIPPCFLARLKGTPLVNIESSVRFTRASKTAVLLQPFSAITALQWKEQKNLLKRGVVYGPLLPKPEVAPYNGGYILVTGGTLGHRMLFDAISETNLENVVLQTGQIDPEQYRQRHPKWKVIDFSTRFYELVAGADIVVTHFGSTALEALVYRKPMVIVLNPEWKRTVGRSDAEIFAEKVNASFIWDVTVDNLLKSMEEAKNRRLPVVEDGAKNLSEAILSL
jgi:UDP-N-acetylglucosamine--N-acetylmuramyl-(pentapeptide) pyrophosphoryl-undecaprenol N-acetylglucosamine transferase